MIDIVQAYHDNGVQSHRFNFVWKETFSRLALEPSLSVVLPPFLTLGHHEFASSQLQDPSQFWAALSSKTIVNAGAAASGVARRAISSRGRHCLQM